MKQRKIGIVSIICLVIGFLFMITYLLTGESYLTMLFGFILLVFSFILSWFSRKDKYGKAALYLFALLLIIYVLSFGVLSIFWNQP